MNIGGHNELAQMTDALTAAIGAYCTKSLELLQPTGTWPPVLYHYTSASSFFNIVKSGKLWVNNVEHLNDKAELRYAISIFRAHLNRALASENDETVRSLFLEIQQRMEPLNTDGVFIASFATDGDNSNMWNLYADHGKGFSFAIPLYQVEHWGGFAACCHYDTVSIDRFCAGALKVVAKCWGADCREDNADLKDYAATFLWNISYFSALFKPHIWADEQEWRLIFVNPSEVKQRENGNNYIEVPNGERLPIDAVCAGPNCSSKNVDEFRFLNWDMKLNIPIYQSIFRK